MKWPSGLAIGAAGAVLSAGVLLGTIEHASAQRGGRAHLALVERSDCGEVAGDGMAAASAPDGPGVSQDVTVEVPSTALLKVDRRGRVVAALTNTGCAPQLDDDVYLVRPDGSLERVVRTRQLVNRRWVGDFTEPGVYVRQTR